MACELNLYLKNNKELLPTNNVQCFYIFQAVLLPSLCHHGVFSCQPIRLLAGRSGAGFVLCFPVGVVFVVISCVVYKYHVVLFTSDCPLAKVRASPDRLCQVDVKINIVNTGFTMQNATMSIMWQIQGRPETSIKSNFK